MPVSRLSTAALLLAAGCAGTDDVTLELADANGDCTEATIAAVRTLSLEAIATDGRCRLAHQCAFNVMVQSVAGLAAALRVADVLLELPAGEAQTLVINGRPSYDCFPREDGSNHPVLCGYARLDQARSGALVLELQRDGASGECPESIALCP